MGAGAGARPAAARPAAAGGTGRRSSSPASSRAAKPGLVSKLGGQAVSKAPPNGDGGSARSSPLYREVEAMKLKVKAAEKRRVAAEVSKQVLCSLYHLYLLYQLYLLYHLY